MSTTQFALILLAAGVACCLFGQKKERRQTAHSKKHSYIVPHGRALVKPSPRIFSAREVRA